MTVTFPWLPPLCSICKEIGHKSVLCPNAPPTSNQSSNSRSDNHPSNIPVSKQPGSSLAEPKKVWIPVQGKNVSEVVQTVDKAAPPALVTSNIQVDPAVSSLLHHTSTDMLAPFVNDAGDNLQEVNHDTGQFPLSAADLVSMSNLSENLASSITSSETPFVFASTPSTLSLAIIPPPITSNPFDILQVEDNAIVLVKDGLSQANSGLLSSSSTSPGKKKKKRKWDAQQSPPHGGVLSNLGEKRHSH